MNTISIMFNFFMTLAPSKILRASVGKQQLAEVNLTLAG